MIELSAGIRVPDLIPRMIESKLSHWQVRHDVLRMNHSVVLATRVERHDVVGEGLVARAGGPESVEVDLV